MAAFLDEIKRRRPSASDLELERAAWDANARNRPRFNLEVFTLFGADILSEDLQSMEAWPYLTPEWRELLPTFPLVGKQLEEFRGSTLTHLVNLGQAHTISRSTLCVPAGLSKTYVWCPMNSWIMDVTPQDAEIIRHRPDIRPKFRPVDHADGPQVVQTFERETVGAPIVATSQEEARDIAAELGIQL